jgi:hypothetical protein
MNKVKNIDRSSFGRRVRVFGAGLAVFAPATIFAIAGVAHADTLDPAYSTTIAPVTADGSQSPATLTATNIGTAWSTISTDPQFTTFASVIKNAGMQSAYGNTAGTFLAPTNLAFAIAGPDVVKALTDPANASVAVRYVKSMTSTETPSVLDLFRADPGSVDPTPVTSTNCVPSTYVDVNGVTWFTGQNVCTSTTDVPPLAPAVDNLTTTDGRVLQATVTDEIGTGNLIKGVALSFGEGYVFTVTKVSNGYVDAIDTVNLLYYAAR